MIKNNEPQLIEFNVRMGDPECQVILPRLKTDLVKIINNSVNDKLKKTQINWNKEKSMTIVLCSKGYPGSYKINKNIIGLKNLTLDKIFSKLIGEKILSNGGRVLNFTSTGSNFLNIRKKILELIRELNWNNGFFRKDIWWKIIKK